MALFNKQSDMIIDDDDETISLAGMSFIYLTCFTCICLPLHTHPRLYIHISSNHIHTPIYTYYPLMYTYPHHNHDLVCLISYR